MIIPAAARLQHVSEYYFSRKLEEVRRMNLAGADVINLGIGSPDLAPSPESIAAAQKALQAEKNHGYQSYRSTPELRKAMAAFYERTYKVSVDAEKEVLPLLGSKEGLFYIALAFLNPGDRVLVPNPGYPAYASTALLAGAEIEYYDLDPKNRWWPDFAELEARDLKGVKLMWVNYPHMPTGAAASEELFRRLVDFGKKHKILICHDNPYSLVLNESAPLSLLSFDPAKEVCLELNSLSKSFNMAGWRIGMLMANSAVVDTVLKVKSNVDSGMFQPLQAGAVEALANPSSWHEARNAVYGERRTLAHKIFDRLGFRYDPKQVGLFIWAEAPASVRDVEAEVDRVLGKAKVFITPGFIFGSRGQRYARMSLCAPVKRMQEALERVEKLL